MVMGNKESLGFALGWRFVTVDVTSISEIGQEMDSE